MKRLVVYIHGKGGSASEADHYKHLFPNSDVIGLDYKSQMPWEAVLEFPELFNKVIANYDSVVLIANSIGAFFAMHALAKYKINTAFFISPIVDMEKLILDMLMYNGYTESDLQTRQEIRIDSGEVLSEQYLNYVRNNPDDWHIPTHILYGENDDLTSINTMRAWADKTHASLTIMPGGEHWFHTNEQMEFLDNWIKSVCI